MPLESPVRRVGAALLLAVAASCDGAPTQAPAHDDLSNGSSLSETRVLDKAAASLVGDSIFNDVNLSLLRNQSCASCHVESFGFSSANEAVNAGGSVQPGSVITRFGSRRTPSAAYTSFTPQLLYDADEQAYAGGEFWDGRATGARLRAAAEQAQFPFLNPVEMALPDRACVIYRIVAGQYADLYVAAWGPSIRAIAFPTNSDELCSREGVTIPLSPADRAQIGTEYDRVGRSIAAFEDSPTVNKYSAKFDAYVDGEVALTSLELTGLKVFDGRKAGCNGCHRDVGRHAFFTDFGYDNIGVPANPLNPALLANPKFRDGGLGVILNDPTLFAAVKAPTLRNLDKRGAPGASKSYMHNGAFKTLEQVVHFYNTRDVLPRCETVPNPDFGVNCWPAPEVPDNVNTADLGDLKLTPEEERALVAFMRTLNDGYKRSTSTGR